MSADTENEKPLRWTSRVEKFEEIVVAVLAVLLVGLIAMGRHVLEIDLHHIVPLTLFGFSTLILALAISYFFVKRAPLSTISFKRQDPEASNEK